MLTDFLMYAALGMVAGLLVYLLKSRLRRGSLTEASRPTTLLSGMRGSGETAGSYRLVLVNPGPTKILLIKALRQITGVGLVEAKAFAERPGIAIEQLNHDTALGILAKLQATGAVVSLQSNDAAVAHAPESPNFVRPEEAS